MPAPAQLKRRLEGQGLGRPTVDGRGNIKQGLSHLEAARKVLSRFGDGNMIHDGVFTRAWAESGVWRLVDDREIKQVIHEIAGADGLTKHTVASILDMTKTEAFLKDHKFDVDRAAINAMNGELHWTGSLWDLRPHSRESYRTTIIPVTYDPGARAPRFEQFLGEIFRDDADREDKSLLVFEMTGYCLMSSCEYERFFVLYGPGANGKSVLMDTIAAVVGPEHVCAVQPSQFENRFQRAHLHGRLVNLVTEIAEGHEIADAQLKAIVSGELTTAEHKHKPPFDFRPFCTCIFGTNHLPHTRDFSDALFRRAILIGFNRVFAEAEQDKHLKDELRKELPGILNFALKAIAGVVARGHFTVPASTQELKSSWRITCDQVAQFIDDKCRTGSDLKEISAQLYRAYRGWAEEAGIRRTLNHRNFTERLVRLGCESGRTGQTRFIHGVELR